MTYRVILQRLAVQDLEDAFVWAARKAPGTAARWLDRFQPLCSVWTRTHNAARGRGSSARWI